MKKRAVGIAILAASVLSVLAQGSLTPPGAPAETMKTLEQVEPRIDLATVGGDADSEIVITNTGSYYLSSNLTVSKTDGIQIEAIGVTLDLNGFEIRRVSGSGGNGIFINAGMDHATVRNGTIVGFSYGIHSYFSPVAAIGCLFEKLAVSDCSYCGIDAGSSARIMECRVYGNPGMGINAEEGASISGCTAEGNHGTYGIYAREGSTVSGCTAVGNRGDYGIYGSGCTISQCSAYRNDGVGIFVRVGKIIQCSASWNENIGISAAGGRVKDCTASNNNEDGILLSSGCLVTGSICFNDGFGGSGAGIHATGDGNRIEGNHLSGSDRGLDVDGANNYVAGNTVFGNDNNYAIAGDNQLKLLLAEVPENIDWPASVKLAGTLVCSQNTINGITVNADHVTIDLDGHALVGPGFSSGHGIYQSATNRNLTVVNGTLSSWQGAGRAGIAALGSGAAITGIHASTNYYGIQTGSAATLVNCQALDNLNRGLWTGAATVLEKCAAKGNGGVGIYCGEGGNINGCVSDNNTGSGYFAGKGSTVSDCSAQYNGGDGIDAQNGSQVNGCTAYKNTDDGIVLGSGCSAANCMSSGNVGDGIEVVVNSRVAQCTCNYNGASGGDGGGIHVTGSDNRIDDNNATDNDRGIDVDSTGNLIIRNSASGNGTNYDIAAGNHVGTIQTSMPAVGGPWDNFEF